MARALTDSKRKIEERLRKKVYTVQLYYGKLPHLPQPLTQSEIAKRIGTSTSQVSLLLKEAQQEGLVEVSIHTPRSYLLEGEIIHAYGRYGLRQARVAVVGDPDMEAAVIDAIGDCAARYVGESLEGGSKVGVGGGRTMRSLVDHMRPGELPELEIYPMESVGTAHVSANTIAANMAATSEKVNAFALPVPPLTSGTLDDARIILDYFLTLEPIAKIYDSLEELDVAIVGMASLTDSDSIERDASYYGVELDIIESISERAVGNVLWQFFDGNGNIVDSELHQRVISVDLDQLREMSRSSKKSVMGVAGGKHKAGVIKAAIVGGFIDTIITDIDTGEHLLEMAG